MRLNYQKLQFKHEKVESNNKRLMFTIV